jgi:hypothetical protein
MSTNAQPSLTALVSVRSRSSGIRHAVAATSEPGCSDCARSRLLRHLRRTALPSRPEGRSSCRLGRRSGRGFVPPPGRCGTRSAACLPRAGGAGRRGHARRTRGGGHIRGRGRDSRGAGDVGDGLLPLAGGAEHLFGEGALLGNQVLGEVEYGVEDLLRVARSVTTGTGPAAHCFHQLVAALAPLFPEVLEVLLGATGQLGELLLWTGHCDLLLDEGTRAPNTLGRKRYPGAAPPTKRGSVTVILGRSPQQSKAPRVHRFSQGEFAESLASAGMPVEAVAGVVSVFQEILDGRNARLTDGVRRALSRPASHFADYGRTAARIEGWA